MQMMSDYLHGLLKLAELDSRFVDPLHGVVLGDRCCIEFLTLAQSKPAEWLQLCLTFCILEPFLQSIGQPVSREI